MPEPTDSPDGAAWPSWRHAEAMSHLVWIVGPDGRPVYVNRRWTEYTGVPLAEAGPDSWRAVVHPEDHDRSNALRDGGAPSEATYRLRRASDGSYRWFLGRVGSILGPGGEVECRVGTATDVHDFATAREALEAGLARAGRLAALGTFAAGIAHELANPINATLLAAELAREALPDSAPALIRTALDDAMVQAERSADVVRDLLRFARGDSIAAAPRDLNAVIRSAVAFLSRYGRLPNLTLALDLADPAPIARIDPARIEQVVLNLAINAAQTAPRPVRAVISTGADPGAGTVTLSVADDGPGLPPGLLDRIFEPFFTTKGDLGTGLGLTIIRRIVADHGGTIAASAAAAGGAMFTVTFPAAEAPKP